MIYLKGYTLVYMTFNHETNPDFKCGEIKSIKRVCFRESSKNEISNYPSRLSSLYVSNKLKEAEFWDNLFISQGRPTFQIVKVKVDRSTFVGDAWNCFEGTKNREKNLKLARSYSNQEKNQENKEPIKEILASGKIKVTGDEYKEELRRKERSVK